jgi:DNA-binding transcriptional regulator YiaG
MKKPPSPDLEAQVAELRLRIDSLERTIRMQAQHRANPVLMDAGPELCRARRVAGWSMRVLGKALSVSPSTLKNWEAGAHPLPEWRAQQIIEVFKHSGAVPPIFFDG